MSDADELDPGFKFGCLALDDARVAADFPPVTEIAPGWKVLTRAPFTVSDFWRRDLGERRTKAHEEGNLFLLVTVHSAEPEVLDADTQECTRRLTAWWYGLLVATALDYRHGIMTFGGRGDGDVRIPRVQIPQMAYRQPGTAREPLTLTKVRSAYQYAEQILRLHPGGAAPDYARLRRGFRAFLGAVEESILDERLHQFVRSIDGILRLPANGGQNQFVHRCRLFAADFALSTILREVYRLRNSFEHLNDWRGAAGGGPIVADERTANLRAYQAELIARSVYQRLLANEPLLRLFRTDQTIDHFWGLRGTEQRGAWGDPLQLDAAAADFRFPADH